MKKTLAAFALTLALTGCMDEPAPPPAPMTRTLPPKIMVDVKVIRLADRSVRQPINSPYIDNRFSPTISDAIKQWAGDRLQAVGQDGQAIVVIKEATLTAQELTTSDSVNTWFTRQQGLRYTGHAEVSLEATAAPGFAMADASATRSVTLPEHPTAEERDDAYYSLLNGLMRDLGQNMESSIQSHMANFIVTPPVLGTSTVPNSGYNSAPNVVVQSPIQAQPMPPQMQGNQMQDSGVFYNGPAPLVAAPLAPAVDRTPVTNNYNIAPQNLQQPSVTVPSTPMAPPATIPLSGPYANY